MSTNLNCRLSPEFYRNAIVATNVATIEDARLIYLSGAHPGEEGYLQHAEFNKKVIEAFKGCRLLVEDSYLKSQKDLDKRQIVYLKAADYSIEGWYDPETCTAFNTIVKVLDAVESLLKKWNPKSEAYTTVNNFSLRFPTPTFTDKTHLLVFCKYQALVWKEEFNLETFPKVQECLRDRSIRALQNSTGPVIVLTGENHVDAKNEPFRTWSKDFIGSLGSIPLMVLNPASMRLPRVSVA